MRAYYDYPYYLNSKACIPNEKYSTYQYSIPESDTTRESIKIQFHNLAHFRIGIAN
jgi:hypothetical protein